MAVAVAALGAGFTGFGFNLVAVPLLALTLGPKDAVTVALLLGVVTSGVVATFAGLRGEINARLLSLLLAGSLPGIVVGTVIFGSIDPDALQLVIGAVAVVSAAALLLTRGQRQRRIRTGECLGVGLLAGSLAATTGTGGPPIVAYLRATAGGAAIVRGTILGHVALVSLFALVGFASRGELTGSRMIRAAELVPAVVIGLAVGSGLFRLASEPLYRRIVDSVLVLVAVSGVIVAIR